MWSSISPLPARPALLQALIDAEMPKIPARGGLWVKHLTRMIEAIEKRELPSNAGAEELLRMMRARGPHGATDAAHRRLRGQIGPPRLCAVERGEASR